MRLIDADSLRKKLYNAIELDCDYALDILDKQITIDATPIVHAMWRPYGNKYMCSCCDNLDEYKTQYCSYCGSKMDLK